MGNSLFLCHPRGKSHSDTTTCGTDDGSVILLEDTSGYKCTCWHRGFNHDALSNPQVCHGTESVQVLIFKTSSDIHVISLNCCKIYLEQKPAYSWASERSLHQLFDTLASSKSAIAHCSWLCIGTLQYCVKCETVVTAPCELVVGLLLQHKVTA